MAAPVDLTGSVLEGKYQVLRLLGRGGMGEVYAGTHVQLGRPVAIKVLHGALVDNESFVARFAREARTAAMLEHPNAVHVYDFGPLADGSAYLVMEYIEGVTLRDLLRQGVPVALHVALDVVRQAGGAIAAAHARGIVHRDLKPENIMVRADAEGRAQVKVVDFGLAKILENQTSQLTNRSELIGTPRYMAPEQFQDGRVDERVDVYALGCVAYELVTGRTPFEGTFLEVVGKHVYADVPRFADVGASVPADVETAIRHALAKDPANRTPSVAEFVREFEAACGPDVAALAAEPMTIHLALPPGAPTQSQPSNFVTRPELPSRKTEDDYATRASALFEEAPSTSSRTHGDADVPTVVRPEARSTFAVGSPGGRATARADGDEESPTLPLRDVPTRIGGPRISRAAAAVAAVLILGSASLLAYRPWESAPVQPQAPPAAPAAAQTPEPSPGPQPEEPAPAPASTVGVTDTPPDKAARSASKPERKSSTAVNEPDAQNDAESGETGVDPDVPEVPDVAGDIGNMNVEPYMTPRTLKRLRKALRDAEAARRRKAGLPPRPPQR